MVPTLPTGTIRAPRFLCRSYSGRLYIFSPDPPPVPGDLVACRIASGRLLLEHYHGQACLGVLQPAASFRREGDSESEIDFAPAGVYNPP